MPRPRPDIDPHRCANRRIVTWHQGHKTEGPLEYWTCPICGSETDQRFYSPATGMPPDLHPEGHRIYCRSPDCGWIAGFHTWTTRNPPLIYHD